MGPSLIMETMAEDGPLACTWQRTTSPSATLIGTIGSEAIGG
jgi:hypothetical protein